MITVARSVICHKSAAEAFAYLSDFTTTTDWDPGTVRTTRISGDGGVGTRYANISQFNGRETALEYEVVAFEQDRRIQLRGENKTIVALDTISFEPVGDGLRVTYEARFTFKGVARVAEPFLRGAFDRLADEAESGLQRVLGN